MSNAGVTIDLLFNASRTVVNRSTACCYVTPFTCLLRYAHPRDRGNFWDRAKGKLSSSSSTCNSSVLLSFYNNVLSSTILLLSICRRSVYRQRPHKRGLKLGKVGIDQLSRVPDRESCFKTIYDALLTSECIPHANSMKGAPFSVLLPVN